MVIVSLIWFAFAGLALAQEQGSWSSFWSKIKNFGTGANKVEERPFQKGSKFPESEDSNYSGIKIPASFCNDKEQKLEDALKVVSQTEQLKKSEEQFKRLSENFRNKILDLDKRISLDTPQHCPAIQIADFFAWAVFKKFEHNDDTYYKLVPEKIELVEVKI